MLDPEPTRSRRSTLFRIGLSVTFAVALPILSATAVSRHFYPLTTQTIDVARGAIIFEKQCSTCHATTGGKGIRLGPNLAQIGETAATRRPEVTANQYILESIVDPSAFRSPASKSVMPQLIASHLSDRDIQDLIGFLTSLGGSPDFAEILNLKIRRPPEVDSEKRVSLDYESVLAGRALYLGKAQCVNCHSLDGTTGFDLMWPSVLTAGQHTTSFLRESILNPSHVLTDGYDYVIIQLVDGRTVNGRLISEHPTNVTIIEVDSGGQLNPLTISRNDIDVDDQGECVILRTTVSPMPDIGNTLTDAEVMQLVDFLKTMQQYSHLTSQ